MNRIHLVLIVAVGVAAGLWLTQDDGATVDRERPGAPFLPELAEAINEVGGLVLTQGDQRVELVRDGDGWALASMAGYPAKFDPVRELLIGLARLSDAEQRTARADRHGDLQVAADGAGAGTRVRVTGAAGDPMADIWIGKTQWQPSEATYLRREGEDQVWLAAGSVRPSVSARTWFESELVSLPATDVQRLAVSGDVQLELARDDSGSVALVGDLPDGRTLATPDPFEGLMRQLARMTFEEVASADAEQVAGDPLRTLRFETGDGGAITLALWSTAGELWATVAAEASAPVVPVGPSPEAEGEEGPVAAVAAEPVLSEAQVGEWTLAWSPWAFKLPSWTSNALLAGWDDWLEPLPEPEPEAAPEDESADPPPSDS